MRVWDGLTAATLPILTMSPFRLINKGVKAWHIAMTPKTFVSKQWRASSRSTSKAGSVQFLPLNSMH